MYMCKTFSVVLATAAIAAASPTVYLIRHGEKPSDGSEGLNAKGLERAQCLKTVFGSGSQYNLGYIMAQTPEQDGKRDRPYLTVKPLADELGLVVDTSCDKKDARCVKDVISNYSGNGNVLVCWEHAELTAIVQELGDNNAPTYPDDRFDIIWMDPSPYSSITSETSESCPGLDN